MRTGARALIAFLPLLALAGGCAPARRMIGAGPAAVASDLDAVLRQYPLAASENIRSVPLAKSEDMSMHLVQIRRAESPHFHAAHDLVVTMMRGEGVLHLDGREHHMRAGDVAAVPRHTPHFFVNSGAEPAVAFVTFAPPYDGQDQVPVQ